MFININAQVKDLNYYIETAIKNNPVLNENKVLLTSYDLRKELVRASTVKPMIFTTANYLFAPTYKDYGYDSAITNGGLYSVLLNLDYPLFRNSALDLRLKNSQLEQNTYSNNISLTEHDIKKNITDLYVKAYLDLKQIDFMEEMLGILYAQKNILDSLAAYGLAKMSDIKLLDIEYQNQAINKIKQENIYREDFLELNLQAGIYDSTIIKVPDPQISLNRTVVQKSRYLVQYESDSLKLEMEEKISELSYQPQLNFFINTGLNAVTYNDILKKIGLSAGLNFTFSLYDGNQKNLNRQFTIVKKNILSNYKNKFIKENHIRITNITKQLDDLDKIIVLQQKQIENYTSLLDMYRNQILTGQLSIIDFINTLKYYASARNDLLTTEGERLTLINEYNYWNW
jgi:outer membrane protein TolC